MLSALVRSCRPTQWVKNFFVLAPLVFAHRLADPRLLREAAAAFLAFSAAASAVYLLNDLRDREQDRRHPLKRLRPIASGELPAAAAGVAAVALAAVAFALASALGTWFTAMLGAYVALNVVYSLGLKHIVILDVMSISAGFLLRVLGGAAAIHVEVSNWLLLCTTFVSLFLAFSKRRHEVALGTDGGVGQRKVLSQYSAPFLDQMINVVTASTVVSYALYAAAPETAQKLGTPYLLATLPMVLFGIFRFLYLLYQQPGARNPTEAILRDPPFLANMAIWGIAVILLIYGR
jgi:4-hydroxybenzoate polyprenyltransferase